VTHAISVREVLSPGQDYSGKVGGLMVERPRFGALSQGRAIWSYAVGSLGGSLRRF
jgi:hypothetical protein